MTLFAEQDFGPNLATATGESAKEPFIHFSGVGKKWRQKK
jgi:hypothetical protein